GRFGWHWGWNSGGLSVLRILSLRLLSLRLLSAALLRSSRLRAIILLASRASRLLFAASSFPSLALRVTQRYRHEQGTGGVLAARDKQTRRLRSRRSLN